MYIDTYNDTLYQKRAYFAKEKVDHLGEVGVLLKVLSSTLLMSKERSGLRISLLSYNKGNGVGL